MWYYFYIKREVLKWKIIILNFVYLIFVELEKTLIVGKKVNQRIVNNILQTRLKNQTREVFMLDKNKPIDLEITSVVNESKNNLAISSKWIYI